MDFKKQLLSMKRVIDPYPYRSYMNRHNVIFIHIPKTAGTSVLKSLGAKVTRRDHVNHIVYRQSNKFKYEEYFKFSFVRNPIERCVSVYKYLSIGGNQGSDKINYFDVPNLTFSQFLDKYLSEPYIYSSHMFKPQYTFIYDEVGSCVLDFLGKQESFDADMKFVLNELGLPEMKVEVENKSKSDVSFEITTTLKDKIYSVYEKDFKYFDYPQL